MDVRVVAKLLASLSEPQEVLAGDVVVVVVVVDRTEPRRRKLVHILTFAARLTTKRRERGNQLQNRILKVPTSWRVF